MSTPILPLSTLALAATLLLSSTSLNAGAPAIHETFDAGALPQGWAQSKGKWTVKNGVLRGDEVAADKHAAVLTVPHPNRNSVIEFDYALNEAQFLHLSMNHAKGHLWRLTLIGNDATLVKDKNKKDPKSKAEVQAKGTVASSRPRNHVRVEINGDQVIATLNGKTVLKGRHADFDQDKPNIRFVVRGQGVTLDNLKVTDL